MIKTGVIEVSMHPEPKAKSDKATFARSGDYYVEFCTKKVYVMIKAAKFSISRQNERYCEENYD